MNITELLKSIEETAEKYGLSKPYMVGGVPRDRILGRQKEIHKINDIDITTGDSDAARLSLILSQIYPGASHRNYDDLHSSLDIAGLHLDFSSNFVISDIEKHIKAAGDISTITPMKKELYSRDFTMNTLLEGLDFTTIYDLTKNGISDIHAKLIKCPIDPNITIGVDPRRILRAIKYAIKFNFTIEDNLKAAMLEKKDSITKLPLQFVHNKMNEIVMLDTERGIDMLVEFKLLPLVPLTKTISDILIQRRQLAKSF